MTGFGLATQDVQNIKIVVEIKSLNSKFLELSLKLPRAFADKELFVRNFCTKEIERGKVNIAFSIEKNLEGLKASQINTDLLSQYYTRLAEVADKLGADKQNLFQLALNMPEVLNQKEEADADEWALVYQTFLNALQNFQQFRLDEGKVLKDDLTLRIANIKNFYTQIEALDHLRVPQLKNKLSDLIEEAIGKANLDQNRLEQEIIYYIDKLDITEEKTRLISHLNYFLDALESPESNGKKLGFIAQEIGREINTMGSKANDAQIQQLVVGMKEELEKIKEQLLNVL
ncbi:MAG: YicC family protein [Pedobacter sp.]|nr:MAG: YicC family protein [Pedobacter sp.]